MRRSHPFLPDGCVILAQTSGDPLGYLMLGAGRNRSPWVRYSGVGVEFAAAIGGFAVLGWWIDRHYGTAPWALVISTFLGLIGATYNLIRQSLSAFREAAADDAKRSSPNE